MAHIEEPARQGEVSESFIASNPSDVDTSFAQHVQEASKTSSRMQKAKQQLKTSRDRVIHSISATKKPKQKAQPRRVEGDEDNAEEETGPNTAFFSPPSFQLTQIIHDSHCFLPRQGHSCVAGGGDVLIFGGQDADGQFLNDFIRYIPGINAFEPMKKIKGQIPAPRAGATMVTWVKPTTSDCCSSDRDHIFLFGGRGPGGDMGTASLYDPGSRTWTIVNSQKKPLSRSSHVSVVFEKVFVHGGLNNETVLGDMWMWDGEGWVEVVYDKSTECMPARCGHSASAWVHKKHKEPCIFFFGGDTTGRGVATNDVWIFSINGKKWKHVTAYAGNPPSARFGHSSCVFDSNWVIISGGYSGGWISNYVLCAQDMETGVGPVSSDVYRLSPLITYVSFAALRNQVESMTEVINLSFDSQSEGVGRAIRKVDALMRRLDTVEKEVEGLRTANEYLTRQLEAFSNNTEAKKLEDEDVYSNGDEGEAF